MVAVCPVGDPKLGPKPAGPGKAKRKSKGDLRSVAVAPAPPGLQRTGSSVRYERGQVPGAEDNPDAVTAIPAAPRAAAVVASLPRTLRMPASTTAKASPVTRTGRVMSMSVAPAGTEAWG